MSVANNFYENEHEAIVSFYGHQRARRSRVPLINHINEGMIVLDTIGASTWAKRGYCLHPLVQEDQALEENFDWLQRFHPWAVALALEYRSVANDYLSHHPNRTVDQIRLSPLRDVNDMLIADKVQNYKDFLIHHLGKHENSERLNEYFQQWLDRLEINPERFHELQDRIIEIQA